MNLQKLLNAIKTTFSHRKDRVGENISRNVSVCIDKLNAQKLSKEELKALHSCCEVAYNDGIGSTNSLIALIPIFLGIDPVLNMFPITDDVMVYVKGIIYVIIVVYSLFKISKTVKDNAMLRNTLMASSILLADFEAKNK